MDCSLFVQTVFGRYGVHLPRTAAEQCEVGQPVSTANLQAGDRLYFINRAGRINHTAIYMGNTQFIHASSNRGCVAIDSLTEPYYAAALLFARGGCKSARVPPGRAGSAGPARQSRANSLHEPPQAARIVTFPRQTRKNAGPHPATHAADRPMAWTARQPKSVTPGLYV